MKTFVLIFILLLSVCLYSDLINVPADQPTIQAGIDASVDADTILVQQGTYYEHINYNGKNITVGSLFLTTQDTIYISQTIIDGNHTWASVVTFESGEESTATLTGFTITHGSGENGGGINCYQSSPSLVNVTIIDNVTNDWDLGQGGGIYCSDSNPILENVTITGNSAGYFGGGIYCGNSSNPILENVTITGNSAIYGGGIYCGNSSNPILENVTITGNSAGLGGGIACNNSCPNLQNVTITNNSTHHLYFEGSPPAGIGGGIYSSNRFHSIDEL